MDKGPLFDRFCDLQRYIGWTDADLSNVHTIAPWVRAHVPKLVTDFYAEIERHEVTRRVFAANVADDTRLHETLAHWLEDIVSGTYDADFVLRRWKVGLRHAQIGLDPHYMSVALGRIRNELTQVVAASAEREQLTDVLGTLNRLLDLDMAVIEDAYQYQHRERLARGERLVAIGQMAAGIAHELRNPLNVVRTSVFYLKNAHEPAPAKVAEHLDRIQRQVAIAEEVITGLSDFAKLPLPVYAMVPVAKLITDVLGFRELPAGITVEMEGVDDCPPVRGDSRQLAIVLGNLIGNAAEAMPSGGRIIFQAMPREGRVDLTVIDSGPGIDPDMVHRIFEPFFTTKTRGIGLGLAMCRAIVENHGGEIRVARHAGPGARLTVSLPGGQAWPDRIVRDMSQGS
jgi:signal transduction histidine kinase